MTETIGNVCSNIVFLCGSDVLQVVLRGSISYNTEFQRPLQYNLELRHLPDNYTFMVMEDAMYSVQVVFFCCLIRNLSHIAFPSGV